MEDQDPETIDPALAAAMGFSAFGAQPSSKKRKYNHSLDTAVTAQQAKPGSLSLKPDRVSGANGSTLGVRMKNSQKEKVGRGVGGPGDLEGTEDSSLELGGEERGLNGHDHASNATTTAPTKSEHNQKKKTQAPRAGLAAFLTPVPQNNTQVANQTPPNPTTLESQPTTSNLAGTASLPPRPQVQVISFGGAEITQDELQALRKGVRDERGDVAYFLPSFVEDPWEKLGGVGGVGGAGAGGG